MNHITRRLAQGTALAAIAAGIVMAGGSIANAATPHQAPAAATVHATEHAAVRARVGTTQGFNLYNYSAETLDFVKVTGSLPAPPEAPILPGQHVNFELPDPMFSNDTGTAYYNVMSPDGTQVANLKVGFSDDNTNDRGFWGYQVTDMAGNPTTGYVIPDDTQDTTLHFEDAKGSPQATQNLAAGAIAEQSVADSVCKAEQSACTFSGVKENTGWSDWKLIAQAYNGQDVAGNLNAGNSYIDQTTDTWGATVTAGGQLGPVNASVQASYSHAVTTGTQFNISQTATEQPKDTTYIWGEFWQYQDTGNMTIHLGNTTWNLPDLTYYNADNTASDPMGFQNTETAGNVMLPGNATLPNSASTPPLTSN